MEERYDPAVHLTTDGIYDDLRRKVPPEILSDEDVHAMTAAFIILHLDCMLIEQDDGTLKRGDPFLDLSESSLDKTAALPDLLDQLAQSGRAAWDARDRWLGPKEVLRTDFFLRCIQFGWNSLEVRP
jgi:hypothetical protein